MAEQTWPIVRALEPLEPLEAVYEVLRRSYAATSSSLGAGVPMESAWQSARWKLWLAADFLDRPRLGDALAATLDRLAAPARTPGELADRFDHARSRLAEIVAAGALEPTAVDRWFVVTLRDYSGRALLVFSADLEDWRAFTIGRPWVDLVKTFTISRHYFRADAMAEAERLADELEPTMNRPAPRAS